MKQAVQLWLGQMGVLDGLLRKRAAAMIRHSKMADYVRPGGAYLDIGSGLGHIWEAITELPFAGSATRCMALEPCATVSRKVRRRLFPGAVSRALYMRGAGEHLPLRSGCLDGVSLFFVLHHVEPPAQEEIFSEILRVLRPGGLLFLLEDTPETEEEYVRNVIWDRRLNAEPEHLGHYYRRAGEWTSHLSGVGLEVLQEAHFEDVSPRADEGLIRHSSFVLQHSGNRGPRP